jgi:hypothetical protein
MMIYGSNGIHGEGVFGTSKPPQSKCTTLLETNYYLNVNSKSGKSLIKNSLPYTECFIRIKLSDLKDSLKMPDAQKPEVFFFEGDIDLTQYKFVYGTRKKYNNELNDS